MGVAAVVAVVLFTDGRIDYLSLEGLAYFRDRGMIQRSAFVRLSEMGDGLEMWLDGQQRASRYGSAHVLPFNGGKP